MQIQEIEIEKLIPYERNNKIHDETQINRIANSIKEFGFRNPIFIDKNNVVINGHGRLLGAKKLGMKTVPCHIAEDLTDEQIKKFRILDNKLNESERDIENLKSELDSLPDLNFGDLEIDVDEMFPELESGDSYYENLGSEDVEEETESEQKDIIIQVIASDEAEAQLIRDDLDNLGYTYK